MNSYFMFVIAVTLVYAIYYAVMIMKDMQVKKEDQSQNGEEFSIDIEEAPEESISVSENADGFSVGENSYETEVDKASDGVQEQSKKESNKQSRLDELKAIQEDQMEESTTFLSNPYSKDELTQAMICRGKIGNRPELEWKSVNDKL